MTAATTTPTTPGPAPSEGVTRTDWVAAIPFFLVHLAPLAAIFVTVTWRDWALCAVLYVTTGTFPIAPTRWAASPNS
jgi:hypothetical protein